MLYAMNADRIGYIMASAALPTFVIIVDQFAGPPRCCKSIESASITPPATTKGSIWEMPLIRWP